MNVAFVTHLFLPAFGGEARSTYNLARNLHARGHSVTIFTSNYGRKESKFEDESGLTIVESRCAANIFGLLYTPEMMERMKETAQAIDVFDLNSFRSYQSAVAMKFARERGVPYVLRARGSLPRHDKSIPKRLFDAVYGNRILSNSSRLIALTQVEAHQYEEFGLEASKISVIPNGVPLGDYSNLPPPGEFASRFKVNQSTKLILFLGRIHHVKGIDTLLRSYSQLIRNGRNADCLLVVAGPDDGYLEDAQRLARRLNMKERVLFTGPLNFRDKLGAFVDSSASVFPSYYEPFGNVVLESYACSRPVIASRVPGMEDLVVDGKTGLLVPPGNVDQLANAISWMIDNVEQAKIMGKQGRELVEREYDLSKVILRTEALYEEIARTPRSIAQNVP